MPDALSKIPQKLADLNIIPMHANEKFPAVNWKDYQTEQFPKDKLRNWNGNFAVVCGAISGNLAVIDFDDLKLYQRFAQNIKSFTVTTPHNGVHIYFTLDSAQPKTQKLYGYSIDLQCEASLAMIPPSKLPDGEYKVLEDLPFAGQREFSLLMANLASSLKQRPTSIHELKRRLNIQEIIARYVKPVKKGKGYWQGICPFHSEQNPSFTVYAENYYCYGCEAHGDVFDFIERVMGLSFKEAVIYLCQSEGQPSPFFTRSTKAMDKEGEIIKVNCPTLAREIMRDYIFKTFRDNGEILYYEDGIYQKDAESLIREEVSLRLGKEYTTHRANEVIDFIRASTYVERSEFNKEVWILNLKNGLLDVKTKTLRPHDHKFLSTTRIPLAFDPYNSCPRIMKFFGEVLRDEDIPLIQELFGYLVVPDYSFQRSFLFIGDGHNGKSTLIELVRNFVGKENCSHEPLQMLIKNQFSPSNLFGKLANLYADLPSASLTETGIFKMLTGGDAMRAEVKFKNPFYFLNRARLIFSSNRPPRVSDDSLAFWRRWIMVNFPNEFPPDKADKHILEKLTEEDELSGLLIFALEGLERLMSNSDFSYTKTIEETAEAYRQASDPVYAFTQDRCKTDPVSWISKDDLYDSFVEYCRQNKIPVLRPNSFARSLQNQVTIKVISTRRIIDGKRVQVWQGIRFRKGNEDGEEPRLTTF